MNNTLPGVRRKPHMTDAADPSELIGYSFLVLDTRELIFTFDGSEDVEDGDTIADVVSRMVDEYPPSLWDLVSREIETCTLHERENDCAS